MAKVVPLASAKAFLDALEKSALLGAGDLESLRSRGEDGDPKLLARELVRDNKLTRWQAGQLLHGFHQLIVGKYKLMDQLGTGEMGRVYLAEHAQLARKVSLKILSRKYTANPEILKKVLEDGRQASALDHRNLSHVFDVNSEDERYYLVTEFVEGKDLRQLVEASGPTSPAQALEIVRQAAEGLEHAHGQGVIHGDLKPSNLIVDASGVVKILDLGLARLTETSPAVGDESTEVVTLAARSFHAPEQSSKHEVSSLVDIYSLGGILFYLLSGKPPLGNVKNAQDVKDACAAASDELAELCARMLAEDPAARPQTARQVIEGLDGAARAKPKPAAKEEKKSSNGEKPQAKHKKPLVAKALEIPFPTQAAATTAAPPVILQAADQVEEISLADLNLGDAAQPADKKAVQPVDKIAAPPTASEPAAIEPPSAIEPPAGDPFSGFTLQTKRKKQKPAPEAAAAPLPAGATAAAAAPAEVPVPARSGQKPSMAIVLGVGIGGGVLILALGVTVLIWAMSRGGKTADKAAVANAGETKQGAAKTPPPEANPEVNPEENPKAETPAATKTPEKTTPDPTKEGPKTTVPMPNPGVTDPVKPPMPMLMVTPIPTPLPKPEPVKPMPKPEPVVPIGNPFVGFAKTVTLPPLDEKGKPVEGATKPLLLGTIKLPPKALCIMSLKGGDNAISTNAKQKFVMESANNGTSERDWDIKVATEGSNTPVIVAKLALQNDQLNFQWTEEAAKQISAAPYSSAPYLCNCLLTMSAGAGSHQLALRQPLTGEPMKVDLEKPMSAKYTIDYPPNPKQIIIQLGPPEGKFPKFKFERTEVTAKKDSTLFTAGAGEDDKLLQIRLDSKMSTKLLQIDAFTQYQIHLMPKPEKYMKATLLKLIPSTKSDDDFAAGELKKLTADASIPAAQKAEMQTQANKVVADMAKRKAQVGILQDMVKDIQGQSKIHFRIFYEADTETKIDLVTTGAPAATPPP